MKKSRSNALVHICAFMLVVLSVSSCKPEYPFENKPHTRYMGLNGKVRDIHMSFFIERIGEHGYMPAEISSLNQYGILQSDEFNPIYNMFFLNMISTFREDVDISFSPLKCIKENVRYTPFVDDVSFTFNKEGFLNNVSWYYNNRLVSYINIKYNNNDFVSGIDQNASIAVAEDNLPYIIKGIERPSSPYKFPWNKKILYDYKKTDSILEICKEYKKIWSKERIETSTDTLIYKNKIDYTEVFFNKNPFPSFYLYKDKKGNISKIERYNNQIKGGTALLKNNYIYSILNDSPLDAKSKIEIDDNGRICTVNVSSNTKLEIIYNSNKNTIKQIIESFFDEKTIYNVEYTFDNYENWIQMEISTDRLPYDKLLNELKDMNKQMKNIKRRESNEVYHNGYFIERYLLNDEYIALRYEYDNKNADKKMLERISNRYIIRRNISYY